LAIVKGEAPEEHKTGFFTRSQEHFDSVKTAVLVVVPGFLPDSGFIGGNVPGEDDFHVGAWLTRIAATTGAKSADEAVAAMEKAYAERVRELTRREMELAQTEFARARHMWERAREEVEKAERMKERATRQIDSTCMEITCQSCRQRFRRP